MLGNYVSQIYNCRDLFLKVQSDAELRKSPRIDGSIANKELRMCCYLQWHSHVTVISKLDLIAEHLHDLKSRSAGMRHCLPYKQVSLLVD